MVYESDTIAAISTPSGQGGIGIVRLSGPEAVSRAAEIFQAKNGKNLAEFSSHQVIYGRVYDAPGGNLLDEALVTIMRGPRSYTREDVVEINCHGGSAVLRNVLRAVLNTGVRPAEPGEFTKRAFLNGRIDLAQAEAVSAIINSRTQAAVQAAARNLSGRFSREIQEIRRQLLSLLARVEAAVDFADEDIEVPEISAIKAEAQEIELKIDKLLAGGAFGRLLFAGLQVVISGRTNVGKSSLLNKLVGEERAIVTDIPGTTRDIVEAEVEIDGVPVMFRDTAGIRRPRDKVEKAGIERGQTARRQADLILFVIDGGSPLAEVDLELVAELNGRPALLVVNKNDLPPRADISAVAKAYNFIGQITTSAVAEDGLSSLYEAISAFVSDNYPAGEDIIVANARHENLLKAAAVELRAVSEAVEGGYTEEVLAEHLRFAFEKLGGILGESNYQEVLDEIFSQFCLGK